MIRSTYNKPKIEFVSNDLQLNLILIITHLMDNLVRKDRPYQADDRGLVCLKFILYCFVS